MQVLNPRCNNRHKKNPLQRVLECSKVHQGGFFKEANQYPQSRMETLQTLIE
jgi:hypothetical protein